MPKIRIPILWDDQGVKFVFGYDAKKKLCEIADSITNWKFLARIPKYEIKTKPRSKPDNVKEQIVEKRGYKSLHLQTEEVAEFKYRPTKCDKIYRMVAVKKTSDVKKGQCRLFDEVRYFFYITNDHDMPIEEVVFFANKRCNHENDIEQLRNGIKALKMPTGDLISNWAYMAIVSIGWTLKSWTGLLMPHKPTGYKIIKMEFRRFLNLFINIPAQVLRKDRQLWFRLIGFMRNAPAFFGFINVCQNLRL